MIILLRLRNISIFALIVLSLSFIYIGYTGLSNTPQVAEKNESREIDNCNELNKITDHNEVSIESVEFVPVQGSLSTEFDAVMNTENFFVEFRMKRDKGRDAQIEILRELVNNPNSSAEIRNKAQNELFTISQSIAAEVKAENLLKAKGYEEAVVVVESNKTTVVIKKKELSQTDITRIGDLVVRATGCELEQIAIIPKQ